MSINFEGWENAVTLIAGELPEFQPIFRIHPRHGLRRQNGENQILSTALIVLISSSENPLVRLPSGTLGISS